MHLISQQHIVPQQLLLDLGEAETNQQCSQTAIDQIGIGRSVVFAKNITFYDVTDFQRQVS